MTYEQFRAYFYRLWGAASLVLVFYGIVGEAEWAVWSAAVGQLLPTTLAVANTSAKSRTERLEGS